MIGDEISHYKVLRKLGEGGMGEVYLAKDTVLGRSVALKILSEDIASSDQGTRRFVEEAKAASALNHPNIATIHEMNQASGIHFIAMEYVEGQTLKQKVMDEPLETGEIIRIATQIADALDSAHSAGIVHRDIKSGNIMVNSQGKVKVLDFGLAKRTGFKELSGTDSTRVDTQSGLILGTVPYMSPEHAFGRSVDHRSDLFSLGVVLYELATGCLPFGGSSAIETINHILNSEPKPITSLNTKISPGLERIINKCLEKRLQVRYQTARELLNDLGRPEPDADGYRCGTHLHNLPQQLTQFIGRQRDITEVQRLLAGVRLVTLTGSGGVGKTRLALQVAVDSLRNYSDGVWSADLASLSAEALVPQTVASILNVREERGRAMVETLSDYLRERNLLLVLDNCEHLVSACALMVDRLLRACPKLRILATSREVLGIAGETVFRVPSLSLPDLKSDIERVHQSEAVQLFINRTASVQPALTLTGHNAIAIAQICIRLEGIPLAIELAASRVRVLSVEQIYERLQDRFSLLTGGSRAALPRHQTLRAAIDWSYNLLSNAEQILFRHLSIFSGGWTLEEAEAVCAVHGVEQSQVLEILSGLVDKSLVLTDEQNGQQRYQFLMTLLQYAQNLLAQTEELQAVERRHTEFVLGLAEQAAQRLSGPHQRVWLERLSAEHDNIRAALARSMGKDPVVALRLAAAMESFWRVRGHVSEARRWLSEALTRTESLHTSERIKALNAAGRFAQDQGDYLSAHSLSEQALVTSRKLDDKDGIARSLSNLGIVALRRGDHPAARSLLEQSLATSRELGDHYGIASSLGNLGIVAERQGDYGTARTRFEETLATMRALGDKKGIATSLGNLAALAQMHGDYAGARLLDEESLAIRRELGDKGGMALSLHNLGALAQLRRDYSLAALLIEESLSIRKALGDKYGIANSLDNLGTLAKRQGKYSSARALHEESLALRRELGDQHGISGSLDHLGVLGELQGDHSAAQSLIEESLAMRRALGDKGGIALSLISLGVVAESRGDHARALSLQQESLTILRDLADRADIVYSLENLAAAVLGLGEASRAATLLAAAQGLRELINFPLPDNEQGKYHRNIASIRSSLGEEVFAVAWSAGLSMKLDQAIDYALQLRSPT